MQTTIDASGRLVVPKSLREQVGLEPGPVTITVAGSGLLIEPALRADVRQVGELLILGPSGSTLTADQVRELRLADQR